jgi:hypothetical protein
MCRMEGGFRVRDGSVVGVCVCVPSVIVLKLLFKALYYRENQRVVQIAQPDLCPSDVRSSSDSPTWPFTSWFWTRCPLPPCWVPSVVSPKAGESARTLFRVQLRPDRDTLSPAGSCVVGGQILLTEQPRCDPPMPCLMNPPASLIIMSSSIRDLASENPQTNKRVCSSPAVPANDDVLTIPRRPRQF